MARATASDLPPVALTGRRIPAAQRAAKRLYTLPLEKLRPVIRIAHRRPGLLDIPERIILDHELVLILAGAGRLRLGRAVLPFKAGTLFFIPPFARHRFEAEPTEGEHIAVHFDLAAHFPPSNLLHRAPYEIRFTQGLALPTKSSLTRNDALQRSFAEIVTHFARGEPATRLRAEALLLDVLATLFERTAAPDIEDPELNQAARARIESALSYIEAHIAEHLAPADLARAAGLSPSHFTRLFRRWAGVAPGEFVTRRRIEHARKLLGDVRLSIKEVAVRSGFEDPYYFSKVFRRVDGLPPTLFREALLAGKR